MPSILFWFLYDNTNFCSVPNFHSSAIVSVALISWLEKIENWIWNMRIYSPEENCIKWISNWFYGGRGGLKFKDFFIFDPQPSWLHYKYSKKKLCYVVLVTFIHDFFFKKVFWVSLKFYFNITTNGIFPVWKSVFIEMLINSRNRMKRVLKT